MKKYQMIAALKIINKKTDVWSFDESLENILQLNEGNDPEEWMISLKMKWKFKSLKMFKKRFEENINSGKISRFDLEKREKWRHLQKIVNI